MIDPLCSLALACFVKASITPRKKIIANGTSNKQSPAGLKVQKYLK